MSFTKTESAKGRGALPPLPKHHWALRHLPVFPTSASKLLHLLNDAGSSYSEFAEVIERDPSFTWEVLKAANSPLFGLPFEVEDIRHAVAIVGVERVKGMVMVTTLSREFRHAFREPKLVECWKHCLATAQFAAELAPRFGQESGVAYTAGLLHDIGRIALMTAFPRKYLSMIEESWSRRVEMRRLEEQFFEIDHCTAGATMMLVWQLPVSLLEISLRHHGSISLEDRSLLANTVAANRIAHLAGFQPVYEPEEMVSPAMVPGGVPETIFDSVDVLRKTVDAYCSGL